MQDNIDILMPVYNSEPYLDAALASIITQTYPHFTLFVLNDGSTDNSLSILKNYAAKDNRIKVLSRANAGYVSALNELLSLARSPLIARMDSDDICAPRRLEIQINYMQHNPDIVASAGKVELIDPCNRLLGRVCPPMVHDQIQHQLLSGQTCLCHPAVIIRRSAVIAAGGYDPSMYGAEDLDLWLRLSESGRLGNVNDLLLQYRLHPHSVSALHADKQIDSIRRAVQNAYNRRGICGDPPSPVSMRRVTTNRHRSDMYVNWGWMSWGIGRWSTPLIYAAKALAEHPFSKDAWRLLACGVLKPVRRPKSPSPK